MADTCECNRTTASMRPVLPPTCVLAKASIEAELYLGMVVKNYETVVAGAPHLPSLVFLRAADNLQEMRDQPSMLPPCDSHMSSSSPTPPWLEFVDHSVEMVPGLMVRCY